MSKKILIVESDSAFSHKLKDELGKNGFEVVETTDGKGAYDLTKKERPELVVLAVELAAGQSGYLVCGKLKKDDDLKKTPVIIIGKDPEGFEGHKKLKTRAEEYLKKPFAPEALTVKVGVLIGMPESNVSEAEVLVADEPLSLDAPAEGTLKGDPDLDMLDDAFASLAPGDGATPAADEPLGGVESTVTPADIVPTDEPLSGSDLNLGGDADLALDKLGGDSPSATLDIELLDEAVSGSTPSAPSSARPKSSAGARPPSMAVAIDDAELKQLREQVRELEDKISGLESQLSEKDAELAAAKASAGGGKDASALKDASLKKDKEILKLKQELNEKETELVELREKEAGFEEKANAAAGEIAKRDAQVKSLTQRVDQLTADKKKSDAAINAAKDEGRSAAAQLDAANKQLAEAQGQLNELKRKSEELEEAASNARMAAQTEVETIKLELDSVKSELESLKSEHGSLKAEHEGKVSALEEETTRLRSRATELEESNAKNEDRVVKAYQKIKGDEKLREKTRKAISVALQLLDDSAGANVIDDKDLNA
ncbi:MAG: response regulator [Deltaproteobacteria bacterium]|nr:response regulator [Deltaproteobacteria bacterium]